jgi:hypothetical protein
MGCITSGFFVSLLIARVFQVILFGILLHNAEGQLFNLDPPVIVNIEMCAKYPITPIAMSDGALAILYLFPGLKPGANNIPQSTIDADCL